MDAWSASSCKRPYVSPSEVNMILHALKDELEEKHSQECHDLLEESGSNSENDICDRAPGKCVENGTSVDSVETNVAVEFIPSFIATGPLAGTLSTAPGSGVGSSAAKADLDNSNMAQKGDKETKREKTKPHPDKRLTLTRDDLVTRLILLSSAQVTRHDVEDRADWILRKYSSCAIDRYLEPFGK